MALTRIRWHLLSTPGRRAFLVLGGAAGAVAGLIIGYVVATAGKESTDDARVDADVVLLAPRVGGPVRRLLVRENQEVRRGDPILEIDDAELRARLERAEAELEREEAGARAAEAEASLAPRPPEGAPAQARAEVARSSVDLALARVRAAEAEVAQARMRLEWARLVAPVDGVVSNLEAREGALVASGAPVAALVPVETYVTAHFKETQIGRLRPGQRARVKIDAFPGRAFEGRVESLSGGTGARFSLLPPSEATGSFVKVVQRVPVRIAWTRPPEGALRAGLSAEVTVFVEE